MAQAFTLLINLFAYSDGQPTNNPQLRDFDYARRLQDVPTSKTRTQQHIVSINESETVMSLQRSLASGSSWTISNPEGVTARWEWSGLSPGLRTERGGSALTTASTVSVVRQGNSQVVRLTFSESPGTGIVAGDEIYLGPNSGLSPMNSGIFTVVAASGPGKWVEVLAQDMVNESLAAVLDETDIYAFSSGPVRVGDYLRVSDTAFNFGNRGEYQITRVTSRFLEVQNSNVVPEGSTPITADIVVYDQLYKLTYLESDQPVNVYVNGATSPIAVEPVQAGQGGLVGVLLWRGPVYSLVIENVGFNAANIVSFFAT